MNYEKFEEGEIVRLDIGFNNTSLVIVVSQTINRMFTRIRDENSDWEVMTNRLSRETKLNKMDNRFHVHNDIEDAVKFYKIPLAMWNKDDVYILQEDRCVFVGKSNIAIKWMQNNEGKCCQSRFPLK